MSVIFSVSCISVDEQLSLTFNYFFQGRLLEFHNCCRGLHFADNVLYLCEAVRGDAARGLRDSCQAAPASPDNFDQPALRFHWNIPSNARTKTRSKQ